MDFRTWLLGQVHRQDAVGRLARDTRSEEVRLARPLTVLNDRTQLMLHVRGLPPEVGITRQDAVAAWAEWMQRPEVQTARRNKGGGGQIL